MAVHYRLYQDNRKESKNKGMWYARAVVLNTVDLDDLSAEIEENVSVKASDVYGVLLELVRTMTRHLQAGDRVKLNKFGSFKIGLKTKPAESAKEFSASKHVVGSRLNFQPETHWSAANGKKRPRVFLDGLKVQELAKNDVVKEDATTEGDDQNNG